MCIYIENKQVVWSKKIISDPRPLAAVVCSVHQYRNRGHNSNFFIFETPLLPLVFPDSGCIQETSFYYQWLTKPRGL